MAEFAILILGQQNFLLSEMGRTLFDPMQKCYKKSMQSLPNPYIHSFAIFNFLNILSTNKEVIHDYDIHDLIV